jgi:AmmeMemoRadiSam system protein B
MVSFVAQQRQPAVAGYFYPADASELRRSVQALLGGVAPPKLSGSVVGIITPHAGYVYSGQTAAYAYQLLKGQTFDSIVVVGPSHREYFDGISIHPGLCYVTPLGEMLIDQELRANIIQSFPARPGILLSDIGHRLEHSVEVQLPFLQEILPQAKFVPIVMGDQRRFYCVALAEALAVALKGKNSLMIASSDLSHYYSYTEAVSLDHKIIADVEAFEADALMEKLQEETAEACGGGPMVAVMMASKKLGATKSVVLYYCNSGDVTGDRERVVGYMSAAFLKAH